MLAAAPNSPPLYFFISSSLQSLLSSVCESEQRLFCYACSTCARGWERRSRLFARLAMAVLRRRHPIARLAVVVARRWRPLSHSAGATFLPWCPSVPHSSSLYLYARVLGRDGACLRARSRRRPRACLTLVALACALDPWWCSRALGSRVDRPRARSRWRSPAWLCSGAASTRFAVVFCISQLQTGDKICSRDAFPCICVYIRRKRRAKKLQKLLIASELNQLTFAL